MDLCTNCGGRLDDYNESQIVCPWCGEPNCWPRLDEWFDFDDADWDWDDEPVESFDREDTS